MNKELIQQALDSNLPIIGYYGVYVDGYEVLEMKETHILRMYEAGEITTQPVCLISDALAAISSLAQPVQPDWLLSSTQGLAKHLARRCYPEFPQFEVLDDLAGVIGQIDNMTTGMERKTQTKETK